MKNNMLIIGSDAKNVFGSTKEICDYLDSNSYQVEAGLTFGLGIIGGSIKTCVRYSNEILKSYFFEDHCANIVISFDLVETMRYIYENNSKINQSIFIITSRKYTIPTTELQDKARDYLYEFSEMKEKIKKNSFIKIIECEEDILQMYNIINDLKGVS